MSKNWSLTLVVAFVIGLSVKAYIDTQQQVTQDSKQTSALLLGKDNQQVDLFSLEDPRVRIVYFGFTRCPDVCPTSLAMLSGALNQIDDQTKAKFRPLFVSLDPERDEANASHQYAQYFHPMIEGLSGSLETTTAIAHQYGVIFRKTELENSELEYTLDHSSYFYFLKPDGTLITKVPHTLTPAPLVQAMETIATPSKDE